MIRCRPGFQTQVIDDSKEVAGAAGAKLNNDMIPAIARRSTAQPAKSNSPLTQAGQPPEVATAVQQATISPEQMQAQADAAWALMKSNLPQGLMTPQIIENPTPSKTPIITSPHDELEA